MLKSEKINLITSPEDFYPNDILVSRPAVGFMGNIRGNQDFISVLTSHVAALQESQFWDVNDLREIQSKRLMQLSIHLSENSPFWSDYFEQNNYNVSAKNILNELTHLPLTSKSTYREMDNKSRDRFFVYPKDKRVKLWDRYTSGTTGLPVKTLYDCREMILTRYPYHFRIHPVFTQECLRDILERKFFIAIGGSSFKKTFADYVYSEFFVSSVNLADPDLRISLYKEINKAGPVILIGFSSTLLKFSQYVMEDGVELPLIATWPQCEPLDPNDRLFMEEVHQAPALNIVASETGPILFECNKNPGKFHTQSERVILEIIDDEENVLGPNREGEVVATVLDAWTTPLLRYRTGDTGKLIAETCTCGRNLPLYEFSGRQSDKIVLPSGNTVSYMNLYARLMRPLISTRMLQLQVQQTAPDNLRVLIVPKPNRELGLDDEAELRLKITDLLGNEKMKIEIEHLSSIDDGGSEKPRFFIPLKETS